MKNALCIVLLFLSVAHSRRTQTKNVEDSNTPRSVNLAVETVLQFDHKDRAPSLKIIKDMQSLFGKLNRALETQAPTRPPHHRKKIKFKSDDRHFEADYKLKTDIRDTIDTLLELEDKYLPAMVQLAADELAHCRDCQQLIRDLTDEHIYRRGMSFIDTHVRHATPTEIREALLDVQEYLDKNEYSDKEEDLHNFLDSIYSSQAKAVVNNLILNLENYANPDTRRSSDLYYNVKKDMKNVFDNLSNLSPDARRSVRLKLDAFWDHSGDEKEEVKDVGSAADSDTVKQTAARQIKEVFKEVQGHLPQSQEAVRSGFKLDIATEEHIDDDFEKGSLEAASMAKAERLKNRSPIQTMYPETWTNFRNGRPRTTKGVHRVEHSFGATINMASLREMMFDVPEKPAKRLFSMNERAASDSDTHEGLSIEVQSPWGRIKSLRRSNTDDQNKIKFEANFNNTLDIDLGNNLANDSAPAPEDDPNVNGDRFEESEKKKRDVMPVPQADVKSSPIETAAQVNTEIVENQLIVSQHKVENGTQLV